MEISRFKKLRFTNCELRIVTLSLTKRLLTTLFFLCSFVSFRLTAAENEQRVPSNISNVTVFLNQAQVTRVAKVNLQPGLTNLVFDKVSPFINLNSIQVKTESNVVLLSVSQRNNYIEKEEKPSFIKEIEDTIQSLNNQFQLIQIKREALQMERDVMNANKKIGGDNSGVKVEDLEDALLLFRKRTVETGEELLKLSYAEQKLNLIKQKFQLQLDDYNGNENSTAEIVVTVKTLAAVANAKIEWSYLVGNASWKPFYDVRVKDTKSELQLVSKAYITQATGESWKNVILKLSTTNPNESGSKPELNTLFLNYHLPIVINDDTEGKKVKSVMSVSPRNINSLANPSEEFGAQVKLSDGIASAQQTAVNIEFTVTSAYTILSDNTPHQVDLTVNNLTVAYAYATVPKMDKDAFVTAKVAGNDLQNQVCGEANIYFDGTFVGKTFINGTTSDSMLISLGRDKRIQVQRTLLKDFSSKSFSGSTKKEMSTWEISIRNTRKEPVVIVVEDQIPVSADKEIEVQMINNGGASFDETTGKLTWKLLLDAEQSQSVRFSFEVKYPKDKIISTY
ncbi:MAG TPA: hypothetical protein DIU05_09975 [Bacteroidetes bacterium]|nr:hypothetical protein [Bacteroidota bacterium]